MKAHTDSGDDPSTSLDCNAPADQETIARRHIKLQSDWDGMVSGYFGDALPDPTIISRQEMEQLYEGLDCTEWKLKFTADEDNTNTIQCGVERIILEFKANYSIPLFKGIISLDDPTEFHFFKARGDNGLTIVFKSVLGNGSVQLYNLSNEFP